MNKFAIIALSLATAFSSGPAWAGPGFVPAPTQAVVQPGQDGAEAPITTIGCNNFTNCPRLNSNRYNHYRNYSSDRRWDRGWDRRHDRYDRYDRRDRWDRHRNRNGAIIGGLAAGALLGGIIASQPRARASGSSHEQYCYSRYRSYRAYDNTYQPNNGPRRQCR